MWVTLTYVIFDMGNFLLKLPTFLLKFNLMGNAYPYCF